MVQQNVDLSRYRKKKHYKNQRLFRSFNTVGRKELVLWFCEVEFQKNRMKQHSFHLITFKTYASSLSDWNLCGEVTSLLKCLLPSRFLHLKCTEMKFKGEVPPLYLRNVNVFYSRDVYIIHLLATSESEIWSQLKYVHVPCEQTQRWKTWDGTF